MKKFVCLFLILIMTAVSVNAQPLYENITEEIVTGGVTLKNIQRFYGDYALDINIARADLKNPHLSLSLLKHSRGIDKTATVLNLASQQEDVALAVNADFFSSYKGDQNFSLGIEIKDNKLLQSHINSDMAAAFFENGALSFSYFDWQGELTAPNGESAVLSHINKPTDYYGALLMYTSDFNAGTSPFLPEGITVVTVQNETVTAKGVSLGGTVLVPEDGYILVIDDNMTPFLEHNFNIGDKVNLTITATPAIDNVSMAFGGGSMLLKDGKKTAITHNVTGNHPRTAIGTNADASVVYFVTVDGRQTHSRGVCLDTLCDILLDAGIYNAINLDGGGSTAMVGKTLSDNSLHKINTPSENRKVINAVAVTTSAQPSGAVGCFLKAQKDTVLSGDSVELTLTPYDKNYNTPLKNTLRTEFKISSGSGFVKDNIYYASGSGKTVIDLYCNGKKTDSVNIFVIDNVSGIVSPPEIILNKGQTKKLTDISVFDKDGNTATVSDLSVLNPLFDEKLVSLKDGSVTALSEGASILTLSHSGSIRQIKVRSENHEIDAAQNAFFDSFNKEASGDFTFNVLGFKGADTLFDRLVFSRAMDTFRPSGECSVIGGILPGDLIPSKIKPLTASTWSEKTVPGAKIVSMELSQGGAIRRGEQWEKLSAVLQNSAEKTVIVLIDSAYNFSADIDRDAFSFLLEKAAKEKNVFVVYNDNENFCRIKNGVRYISIASSNDENSIRHAIENTKYLSFNITLDGATYTFKKLYN